MIATANINSIADTRLTHLVRLGGGEGFTTYRGEFEGQPAFVVDSGTMNEFLAKDDAIVDPVSVQIFETDAERDAYWEQLRDGNPAAFGTPTAEW